ncbi:MAG: Rpn family recombination-promoting nuclease/putative transposase [Salinispira sp.]
MGNDHIGMVHDQSWKYAFENPQIFWHFIYSYFNKDLALSIVPGSMLSIKTEFIHKGELRHSISDVIYKTTCNFNDKMLKPRPLDVYFIIEFQSTVDTNMPGRIYNYAQHLSERISSSGKKKADNKVLPQAKLSIR